MTWIQTYTGKQFFPLNPRPEDIDLLDITHSLSMQCRFTGHCQRFYSVAEHCVRIARIVHPEARAWGLLHDAAEAYLTDVAKPIKSHLGNYSGIEDNLLRVIAERFGLEWPMPESVRYADMVLLATEARDLMGPPPAEWDPLPEPLGDTIIPMSPHVAEALYLGIALELGLAS